MKETNQRKTMTYDEIRERNKKYEADMWSNASPALKAAVAAMHQIEDRKELKFLNRVLNGELINNPIVKK